MSALARLRWLPLLLAPILTSCATTGTGAMSPQGVERVCAAWPYVTWSVRDTPATIADAKVNNAAKTAFCADGG